MPNGTNDLVIGWFVKALLTIGTAGMCALTGKVWNLSNESSAAHERIEFVRQEQQNQRIILERIEADMNTLLSRKP